MNVEHGRVGPVGRLAAVVAIAVIVLSACTGAGDGAAAPRPIDDILDGDIMVEPDPSGTAAVVRATTTMPVACAVVYGPDDDFGSIAVDDDMQGGAHAEHRPRLTGLRPDTEYRYVLQGSDAAGVFYRSDVMTFRTPPADQAGAPGDNVAPSGTVVAASSSFSDAFAPGNAIDGDLGTEWSSAGDGDDAWIEIDLGGVVEIVGVGYRSRAMTDGTAIVETYTVTVDGGETFGPFATDDRAATFEADGRRLRFDAETTTGGNTGAVEIDVYAGR